jgi:hypothetical protein
MTVKPVGTQTPTVEYLEKKNDWQVGEHLEKKKRDFFNLCHGKNNKVTHG